MEKGEQRLDLNQLKAWEALGYGMFIHYGMSTFDNSEHSKGDQPSSLYAPDKLDVGQWISTARDSGMKYAILTTKHVSGHCLWPSKYTDYHVGTSSCKTDVVGAFVSSCRDKGIMPGFYYCSWDNHHLLGSITPSYTKWEDAFTSPEYLEFQYNQICELITQYGQIGEIWIDIPKVLPRGYRHMLYDTIAQHQPHAIIVMNHGIGDGTKFSIANAWPTDVITIERFLPSSHNGYTPWREIEGSSYYIPGEVCDPIGHDWFYVEHDQPRSDEELLGMYLITRARGANFLLDVGPDTHGLIPERYIEALKKLRRNIERFVK